MTTPCCCPKFLFLFLAAVFSAFSTGFAKAPIFEPIAEEELALAAPKIDPEADVEYLYRSTTVDDRSELGIRKWDYLIRLKIFTEKGVKALDVINIFFDKETTRVRNFAARVTNPDGTVLELDSADLYDRTVFELGDYERHSKAFSFPQLQVGSIVEYSWLEEQETYRSLYSVRFLLRERWPTHKLRQELIPYRQLGSTLRGFNCELEFTMTDSKTYLIEAKDLIADKDEPYSLADYDFKPWVFMRYVGDNDLLDVQEFWDAEVEDLWEKTKRYVKPKQGAVVKLAKELFEGAADNEEKLRRAFDYCTEKVTNIYSARSGFTHEDRKKLKDVDTPAETIKRGYGSGLDQNRLFASLAEAAGFEARLAQCGLKSQMGFNPAVMSTQLNFPNEVVVVRKGEEKWRFFDLGYDYIPYGYLDAECMSNVAMVADPKSALSSVTPPADADFSTSSRQARLTMSEDGTLGGSVSMEYSGYSGVRLKRRYDELSDKEREETFVEMIKERLPRCEVTNFKMEDIFTRDRPLRVTFDVKIPEYGESLGKRIFFQPNVFEFGSTPMFEEDDRESLVAFRFPWVESDEIWITFPEGYHPEEASSPGGSFAFDAMEYETTFALNKSQTKLRCSRVMKVKETSYKASGYGALKALFDEIYKQNTHVLTLVASEESE